MRLRHAVMEGISNAAILQSGKDGSLTQSNESSSGAPLVYLCTGLDVFISREPCVMCAMALVHSRVRRVIFAEKNTIDVGGLKGAQIHTERALNHRFEAFHLELEKLESADDELSLASGVQEPC
jgi:tRNA-specific adenosine deaminase 3